MKPETNSTPDFRLITDGLQFPEGPIAMPDGSVILVEIRAGRLSRVTSAGTIEVIAELGGGPNGAAMGPDGWVYVCNNGGFKWHVDDHGLRPIGQADDYSGGRIEKVHPTTGETQILYRGTDKVALKGPNDMVFDATGGMWFTDLGKVRARDWDRTGVFYAHADGSFIEEVIFPMITPNGIALSPDDKVLYVAETQTGRVWAFDIVAPGKILKHPWPSPHGGRLLAGLPGHQNLDSMAVDAAGQVCVATLLRGGINVIDPDSGDAEYLPMPDLYTTNICFGGPDLRTAYVTLSNSGRLVAFDWPRPGLPLHFLNR